MYDRNQAQSGRTANNSNTVKRLTPEQLAARKRAAARREAQKRKQRRALVIAAGFFICCVGLLAFSVYWLFGDRPNGAADLPSDSALPTGSAAPVTDSSVLPAGIEIQGLAVGGRSVGEARGLITDAMKQRLGTIAIVLKNDSINATLTAADMGAYYDVEDALARAIAAPDNSKLQLNIEVDTQLLNAKLVSINDSIPNHAVNATVEVETRTDSKGMVIPSFKYNEGTNGMQLNYAAVLSEVLSALQNGELTAVIEPEVTVSEPAVTVESLKAERVLLANYVTTYRFKKSGSMTEAEAENHIARDINIIKASELMRYTEIKPGESFSFNSATGNRNEQNGWALANAVYNEGYRKEAGGGVCQISTTMFNALLKANVEILERRGHSIPSDYVTDHYEDGLGFDATVDYGHIDFRFRNNHSSNLYMLVYVTSNSESSRKRDIHVEIYGKPFDDGVEYRLRNSILVHTPAGTPIYVESKEQPAGYDVITKNPHDYYKVETYVDRYVNGKYVETVRTEVTVYEMITETHLIGITPTPSPNVPTSPPVVTNPPTGSGDPFDPND